MKRVLFFAYFVGYIISILAPIFIDPKLTSHVSYGARYYPFQFLTIPIIVILVISELIILQKTKRIRELYWSLIPFGFAYLLTLPIFTPEIPHMNITVVCGYVIIMSIATIAIQDKLDTYSLDPRQMTYESTVQIEYLKEAISAVKQLMVTVLIVYAGALMTWYTKMLDINKNMVNRNDELFLLSINSSLIFSGMIIYFLFGPMYSGFKTINNLLHQMKSIVQPIKKENEAGGLIDIETTVHRNSNIPKESGRKQD